MMLAHSVEPETPQWLQLVCLYLIQSGLREACHKLSFFAVRKACVAATHAAAGSLAHLLIVVEQERGKARRKSKSLAGTGAERKAYQVLLECRLPHGCIIAALCSVMALSISVINPCAYNLETLRRSIADGSKKVHASRARQGIRYKPVDAQRYAIRLR